MKLKIALDNKKFDYRVRDRLVGDRKLQSKDVEQHLEQLPDESANIDIVKGKELRSKHIKLSN